MDVTLLEREMDRLSAPLGVAPRARAALLHAVSGRTLAKGEHLFREGDTAQALYFVRTGMLRYYYLADGVEHTGQFFNDGMFVADVAAFITGAAGLQNIDALAPTEVLVIPRAAIYAGYDADQGIERFGRRLMEEAMAGSQRRSASLLKMSPEDRYAAFISSRPVIAQRVPQYVIASYLGVTPEALSRIRRRRTTT